MKRSPTFLGIFEGHFNPSVAVELVNKNETKKYFN
jgi:hypothetical protein